MNLLLEKQKRGDLSLGTFTHLKSTAVVECMGCTGLDYVLIDSEHSALSTDQISAAITAADAAGIMPLVRINEISRRAVLHPLDAGARGLIVPAVKTVEQVRQLVEYAKFAPLGDRGFAPTRDGKWGTDEVSRRGVEAYMENSNREELLIPQCETVGCYEHIEEIAAMDGVDGIFVGPLDLSIALGHPLQMDAPELQQAIRRILDVCHQNGKLAIIYANDAGAALKMAALGFDSVTVGADAFLVMEAYQNLVGKIRSGL